MNIRERSKFDQGEAPPEAVRAEGSEEGESGEGEAANSSNFTCTPGLSGWLGVLDPDNELRRLRRMLSTSSPPPRLRFLLARLLWLAFEGEEDPPVLAACA